MGIDVHNLCRAHFVRNDVGGDFGGRILMSSFHPCWLFMQKNKKNTPHSKIELIIGMVTDSSDRVPEHDRAGRPSLSINGRDQAPTQDGHCAVGWCFGVSVLCPPVRGLARDRQAVRRPWTATCSPRFHGKGTANVVSSRFIFSLPCPWKLCSTRIFVLPEC